MDRNLHLYIRAAFSRFFSPSRIFILSFAAVIFLGAILLYLPQSSSSQRLTFVDAFFSSASAVCVTGLAVIDIGKDLSFTGQVVTLILFQVGGLGILTFSAFFFSAMGRGLSFKGREIIQSTFLHTPRTELLQILRAILISTFLLESIGALVLFCRFWMDFTPGQALFHAVYNAVSAFNNCGYTLFSDSLIRYQGDLAVNITVMALIVLGGIGFVVHQEVAERLRGKRGRTSLHTRIVVTTSLILIASGALLFYLFERENILKGVPQETTVLISLFQSVTPRTAGFNTVDISQLSNATILMMMILMFIGASPGSTGGGIKTSSTAILFLMMWNKWKGYDEVNVGSRTVPKEIVTRTVSIVLLSAFSVSLITSVLLLLSPGGLSPAESRGFFVEYLFECVSAFGTVGLSMGATPELSDSQKIAVVLMMFAGRVGPLTLAFSLSLLGGKTGLTYAEEPVMVG
ncbi:MAG: potassium transporter TrkG [Thermodesulfobacteriota bacterium]